MIDELNEDEQAMVELVRDFVNREVRPVVRDLEHANTYPDKLIEQMKQLGIYGLAIPEPWGDAQVSTPCYARITEELSRGWMSLAGAMGGHTVVAKLLLAYGTDEQKDAYLPRMATGELRATMALTEPGGGSDLQAMRTVARRVKGDGPGGTGGGSPPCMEEVGEGSRPLRFEVGHGDLLVMGGSCQRTWEHAVPKTSQPVGPRISVQFRPRGVR